MIATLFGASAGRSLSTLMLLSAFAATGNSQPAETRALSDGGASQFESAHVGVGELRDQGRIANEAPLEFESIKRAWQARQDVAETVKCNWVEIRRVGDAEHLLECSVRLKDDDMLLVRRSGAVPELGRTVERDYVYAFDGTVSKAFYGPDARDAETYPMGFVSSEPSDWDNQHLFPLLMTFRPFNRYYCPITEQEYVVDPQIQAVNSRPCAVLRPKQNDFWISLVYYVDVEREFNIVRVVQLYQKRNLWSIDIEYGRHPVRGWLPVSWTCETLEPLRNMTGEAAVTGPGVLINEGVADEDFDFEFPPKTLVTDRLLTDVIVYLTRENGGIRIVTSDETRDAIDYPKLLQTDTGEAVEDR